MLVHSPVSVTVLSTLCTLSFINLSAIISEDVVKSDLC
jgi:hypothetical protein